MMTSPMRVIFLCFIAALAGKTLAADAPTLLATPGKLVLEDDFSRSEMAPKWKVGKGFFAVKDGVVTAAENPADNHPAFAKATFPFKDIVADFSFELDGAKTLNFTMDDKAYKGSHAGHICSVSFTPTMVHPSDAKFGSMKNEVHEKMTDPKTTAQEKKEIQESIKDKSASYKVKIEAGTWHQAHVEIAGDEMLVELDGKPVAYLKSEGIDHPTKNMLGFTVAGKSALIKDVKVWDATPSPEWSSRRPEVLAAIKP